MPSALQPHWAPFLRQQLSVTRGLNLACVALFLLCGVCVLAAAAPTKAPALELSRPVRSWEFLPAVGQRAALFGNEAGQLEAWVYPLKLFRELHLTFHAGGERIPAESLARTVTARPESATILYASDTFQVQETLFVPVKEQGAVIILDLQTKEPLQVEASFVRDFTLEWPAALGASYMSWEIGRASCRERV